MLRTKHQSVQYRKLLNRPATSEQSFSYRTVSVGRRDHFRLECECRLALVYRRDQPRIWHLEFGMMRNERKEKSQEIWFII